MALVDRFRGRAAHRGVERLEVTANPHAPGVLPRRRLHRMPAWPPRTSVPRPAWCSRSADFSGSARRASRPGPCRPRRDAAGGHHEPAAPVVLLVHPDRSALHHHHVLIQDRVLHDRATTADAPIIQDHRPLNPGPAVATRTPDGDSTEFRTSPPETMTPLLTTLLIARPTRSPASCTNLAGGCDGTRR